MKKYFIYHLLVITFCLLGVTNSFAQKDRIWGTYYGGGPNGSTDFSSGLAVDDSGNVYMVGHPGSNTTIFATPGAHQSAYGNIFLVKFNSAGVRQWVLTMVGWEGT